MSAAIVQRRPHKLAHDLVDSLGGRIRSGKLAAGDKLPTEADLMAEFSVSRTVVREAISRLQAAGLVETRHGVGTFVVASPGAPSFRIGREQLATLEDVIAMLELRIGVEVEAAGLAALRRTPANLARMRAALDSFVAATEAKRNAVGADFEFHLEIMRATQNAHFVQLLQTLGTAIIPRARLDQATTTDEARQNYLRRVHAEHESLLDAIANQDPEAARAAVRTHLANSRERWRRAAAGGDAQAAGQPPTA
jgi:GntR family transcriptional repressor for pyruvate dehydrogenase complex